MSEREHHICPPSVAKWLNSPVRTLFESPKKLLKSHIKPGMKIVDLGCGGGIFSVVAAQLTDENSHIYAVDLQQEMLDITSNLAKKKKVENKISYHLCNANDIELEEGIADLILAIDMIHETGDPDSAFTQIGKIAKEKSSLIIMEPKMHVNDDLFNETIELADKNGFVLKQPLNSMMGRGGHFVKK